MHRAALALVSLSLLLAACGSSRSDGSAAPRETKPPYLGTTAGAALLASPKLLTAETRRMARVGVTTLRAPVYWSAVEPTKGTFDWSSPDRLVTAAAEARLALLPVLLGTPSWAASGPGGTASPPRRPADYAAFAAAAVRRYGPRGSFWRAHPKVPKLPVRAWQLWNEPNHVYYWHTQPFAKGYVTLARAARTSIRRADPHATVVMAGFADRSWQLIAQVYRAGAKGVFDVVAIHPYTFQVKNVVKIVRFVRAALRRAGDGKRPLWATEVTWSSGQGKVAHPLGFETTASGQARRLAAALPALARLRRSLGLQRIYWESWATRDADRGNPFDYSGLLHVSASGKVTPKPAYRAYVRFARHCAHGC